MSNSIDNGLRYRLYWYFIVYIDDFTDNPFTNGHVNFGKHKVNRCGNHLKNISFINLI